MDKIPTDISNDASFISTTTSTETRTLRDVVHNSSKRSGGNYGSLAKSQVQPIFYIPHKIESDDTLQRLALKYSITVYIYLFFSFLSFLFILFYLKIQEIKRVNKLWSDAELGLLEHVYIPVNSTQLSNLRTIYPTLEVVQSLSPSTNHQQKTSDEPNSSIRSSDSTNSIPTTNNSSYQDFLSKIDQQIRLTKDSLQSLDIRDPQSDTNISENTQTTSRNTERHKGVHHLTDNSVFVSIPTQNSREKHVSAALKRLQQEQDNFDEL